MTSRDEPRRKRRSDSFRQDEADEADNWLAGLRGGGRGEPDPFAAPPPEPAPFDRPGPPPGSFDRPGPPERSESFEHPGPLERSGSFDRPGPLERPGAADRTTAIERPRAPERPGGYEGSGESRAPGAPPRGGWSSHDDSPSGVFGPSALPPAPPPARPNLDGWSAPEAAPAGRRRAADDSPAGTFGRATLPASPPPGQTTAVPPAAEPPGAYGRATPPASPPPGQAIGEPPAAESRGRRRAREEAARGPSESYDHGPQLTPIIKSLAELTSAEAPTEPPPLVPIFPNMRPDSPPTSGDGRRSRRAAEDDQPAAFTGDATGGRGADEPAGRRRRDDSGESGPRTGDLASGTGDAGGRTGDLGGRRRAAPDEPRTGNGFDSPAFGADRDKAGTRRDEFGGEPGPTGRGSAYAGETTMFRPGEDSGARRQHLGANDEGAPGRVHGDETGRAAPYAGETTMFRPGEDSGARRREAAPRRPPALDEPPRQRRALDDAVPAYNPYDDPSAARGRGDGRRGSGEHSGDYSSGGTRRALREPPGGGSGHPDRFDRDDRDGGHGRSGGPPARAAVDPAGTGPRPHRWVALLSVVAVLVVLGACAMGTWFILKDEKNGPDSAKSSATTGPKKRDISSRDVDPKPLTEAEVFPSNNIVAAPDEQPYVILATKASNDCKVAATEELAKLLANGGCSEVVRATMKSPTGEYLITAGIFNLSTEKVAAQTFDDIRPIVDAQKGRFAGMSVGVGTGTDALVRAPTQLGWNFKGHFITYCVIARVDGKNFAQDDQYPKQITFDIVETYLDNGIIENRAVIQPEATPAASLPASQPPN
ncbi:hypothetical protein [Dactylosporangium sp. NPDC051484]|uniref:hypothetical protein n=1 Tax=Dactylosporangium sp. NPDC051484 TaxID=3154942 RepID=UPI00344B9B07